MRGTARSGAAAGQLQARVRADGCAGSNAQVKPFGAPLEGSGWGTWPLTVVMHTAAAARHSARAAVRRRGMLFCAGAAAQERVCRVVF